MLSVPERISVALARVCAVVVGCVPIAAVAALAWGSIRWFASGPGLQVSFLIQLSLFTAGVVICAGILGGAVGTVAAVAAEEFVPPLMRGAIQAAVGVLAATPAVVYGWFAVNVETPTLLKHASTLSTAGFLAIVLLLAVMSVPTTCALCTRALRHVPDSVRQGAAAAGASRLQATALVVLPALRRRIAAASLAAIGRCAAEGTAVMLLVAGLIPHTTVSAWILESATLGGVSAAMAVAPLALIIIAVVGFCSWIVAREFRWLHWA